MYSNKYIANLTKICETKFVSEDSIGLENPPKTPGNISWRQNAEKTSDSHTRPSFKQKLLRILGIGGIVASSAAGVEATGVRSAVGETIGNAANNLVLTESQRQAIQYKKLHPDKLRSLVVINPDDPYKPVNLRNAPDSINSKLVGQIKPGTYIETALPWKGNDPMYPDNPKATGEWFLVDGDRFIYAKYTEAPQPNPLNPKNQPK